MVVVHRTDVYVDGAGAGASVVTSELLDAFPSIVEMMVPVLKVVPA
jgi:hypothetical protein